VFVRVAFEQGKNSAMTAISERNHECRLAGRSVLALPFVLALLGACTNTIAGSNGGDGAGNNTGTSGSSNGGGGGTSGNSGASGTGNGPGVGGTTGVGGSGIGGSGIPLQCADQAAITPGQAPLRRLTIPEYNHTVRDIIGEMSNPASESFPAELSGNGFGNDALSQPVSSLLAGAHNAVAEAIAARVTGTPAALAQLLPCSSSVTASNREACARTFIDSFVPRAYRRPLVAGEADELVTMFSEVSAIVDDDPMSTVATQFASSIAAIIEAVLVSPDFLYKPEFGQADAANPSVKRPTGWEMATRLSYLYLASSPDDELVRAAQAGELTTNEGVRNQAERLVGLPETREMVGYFFEAMLPLGHLTDLPRDAALFPTFNSTIGSLMQQETRTFLEREVFEAGGSGTWAGILTAPYSYMNGPLAAFYGMQGVTGDAFQRVDLDTKQRRGLLTQGAILAGLTHSNHTNPVSRGGFVVNLLMCRNIGLPSDPAILAMVTPPDPTSAPTGRERYTNHSKLDVCAGCHYQLDPVGFALENYDAVGLWRATENNVPIDASGEVPDMPGGDFGDCPSGIACAEKASGTKYQTPCNGSCATELAERLGRNAEIMACFPTKWLDFAYGQTLLGTDPDDVCNRESLASSFIASGSNIKQMLVDISQTDGFLYLGSQE
jgi:hypothetical protein